MGNPYRSIIRKTGEPVTDQFKLPGQDSPMMNGKGEMNASSVTDMLKQIGNVMSAYTQGDIVNKPAQDPERVAERSRILAEALDDKSGKQMQMLGEALAAEIIDTTSREGFSRRFLQYREIGQGEVNVVKVREHNVTAWIATSSANVQPTIIRGRKMIPPEFNCESYILIDLKEIATTPGDLLEDKYEEGLEAVMVQEDRLWKQMADGACSIRNTPQYFTTFTPQVFTRLRTQVARWGIPVPTCAIAYDIWDDIIANAEFGSLFDPVTKWELIQEGYLGNIIGCTMVTDAFRQPNLRVLNDGETYTIGAPINHGVLTVRGSILVEPINTFNQGKSAKGWFINQIMSMVIGNSISIARGNRI